MVCKSYREDNLIFNKPLLNWNEHEQFAFEFCVIHSFKATIEY